MNIYGIPFIIPFDVYMAFLGQFSAYPTYDVFISSPMVMTVYVFINFVYLWFMLCVIVPFIYKCVIFVKNSLFR